MFSLQLLVQRTL